MRKPEYKWAENIDRVRQAAVRLVVLVVLLGWGWFCCCYIYYYCTTTSADDDAGAGHTDVLHADQVGRGRESLPTVDRQVRRHGATLGGEWWLETHSIIV